MILSRDDALELHGAIVATCCYREGKCPACDALLSRLETFIAGSCRHEWDGGPGEHECLLCGVARTAVEGADWRDGYSVRV